MREERRMGNDTAPKYSICESVVKFSEVKKIILRMAKTTCRPSLSVFCLSFE